jgi:two-component system, chemotaxis family, chemotaxis protein CheY
MAKILIVDDSAISRKLMIKILDTTEHEVVGEAESGEKAILQYRKLKPDVLMMDLDMPGMGGLEASLKIKEYYPEVKIVIVSAHEQSSLTNELSQYGLYFFISKPINREKIINALQNILLKPAVKKTIENNASIDSKLDSKIETTNPSSQKNIQIEEQDLFDQAILTPGNIVSASHFSSAQDLKVQIIAKEINELTIKFIKEFSVSNFSIDEPITLSFESKNDNYICEANITFINPRDKNLKVHVTKIHNLKNQELLECFPTSISVNVKEEFQTKNQPAIIKNIGVYSMVIVGKSEFFEGSKVIFDMYLDSKAFSLSAEITSKFKTIKNYEYGAKVTFIDLGSKRFLNSYIIRMRNLQIESILNLLME